MHVIEIQQRLRDLGFDPGPADGILGRMTMEAIRGFQAAKGLAVDGIAGPVTIAALAAATPASAAAPNSPATSLSNTAMPWLIEAQRAIGVKEDTSPANNPLIIGWARRLRIDYAKDEIPWCGLYVAHCVGFTLPQEALPTSPLLARAWSKFGVACDVPQPGAIMVFWRGSPTAFTGHVGFYVGEDATAYHILGGNQGDAVNVKRFPRNRFLHARWPITAPPPAGGPRAVASDGAFSGRED